jgi:signal transduction histidine kinase
MHSIAILVAGYLFYFLEAQLGTASVFVTLGIWLIVAITYDQTNLWLLIGMIWLVSTTPPRPFDFWRENRWAMVLNISVLIIGGSLLNYAVLTFGWVGIVIFFIPIVLSSFSFQLYVRQMQAHMDNLENIVAERTDALKGLMREKDSFLAVLTHDMKSPLTTIGLYAGLLREKPDVLLERPYITDRLSASQETLLNIVNNILDLEKMQTDGNIPLDKENFDLVLLIDTITELLKAQANHKDITLEFCPKIESLSIMADRSQVERIMQNLVSNAIKYTPRGMNILIKVSAENDNAVIDVIDSGYGIPEEELPFIFERFRRVAKHKKNAPGTGLGLAITKALVEAHDGQISVISDEDKGSQFTFTLPL